MARVAVAYSPAVRRASRRCKGKLRADEGVLVRPDAPCAPGRKARDKPPGLCFCQIISPEQAGIRTRFLLSFSSRGNFSVWRSISDRPRFTTPKMSTTGLSHAASAAWTWEQGSIAPDSSSRRRHRAVPMPVATFR